jgi:hypothetical protein
MQTLVCAYLFSVFHRIMLSFLKMLHQIFMVLPHSWNWQEIRCHPTQSFLRVEPCQLCTHLQFFFIYFLDDVWYRTLVFSEYVDSWYSFTISPTTSSYLWLAQCNTIKEGNLCFSSLTPLLLPSIMAAISHATQIK